MWSGPDLDHPKVRLVRWKRLCRPREFGGWGILDLEDFNLALLGKWWWKISSGIPWCGDKVISFNYYQNSPTWNLYFHPPRRKSFFWNGLSNCISAFRACLTPCIFDGTATLFWFDRWINGCAPMHLWPVQFRDSHQPLGTLRELKGLMVSDWFPSNLRIAFNANIGNLHLGPNDSKNWCLTANGTFSVKSFYGFLRHGGTLCGTTTTIWKSICPKKVILFNWLAWDHSILTMDKLACKRCNKMPTTTCVLCHAEIESAEHLLISCCMALRIWTFFTHVFKLPDPSQSLHALWGQ